MKNIIYKTVSLNVSLEAMWRKFNGVEHSLQLSLGSNWVTVGGAQISMDSNSNITSN